MAVLETAVGIGMVSGPVLGTILYNILGFSPIFFIQGVLFMLVSPLLYCCIPAIVDQRDEHDVLVEEPHEHEILLIEQAEKHTTKLTYTNMLKQPRVLFAALAAMLVNAMWACFEPVLAIRIDEFHLSPVYIGIFFACGPVSYLIVGIIFALTAHKFSTKGVMILCALLCAISCIIAGPSEICGLPE